MKPKIVLNIVLFLLFVSGAAFAMGGKPKVEYPDIGTSSIDFTLRDLNNKLVELSDCRGKVVFLNFFETTCPACLAEMPSIQKLHGSLALEDFVILAIAIDADGANAVRPFVKEGGYTFRVLLDSEGDVAGKYFVRYVPTTFIIDKGGKIVDRFVGAKDWADPDEIKKIGALLR